MAKPLRYSKRQADGDGCALVRRRLDADRTAHCHHALAHADEAQGTRAAQVGIADADAVVLDLEEELPVGRPGADLDDLGPGVPRSH